MMETMKNQREEEMNALRFYQGAERNAITFSDSADKNEKETSAPTLTKTQRPKAPDKDKSAMIEAKVSQAENAFGKTSHIATTPAKKPIFSTNRVSSHEFQVAPQLLYPVTLRNDFFTPQGIDVVFSTRELEWDGARVRVPMPEKRVHGRKPG
ncbi:hypothetical protein PI124_g14975 [Phytophthora idaei]|nr:hypothetical protein PI126_g13880 [Phytophthora idaei]KAG3240127.1 hypothetical protein PI124_g14975 [Phytophthora idaei]